MSCEVLPVGIACNLKCTYCYEAPLRNGNSAASQRYNREAVLAAIDKLPAKWSLFGGEALILPIDLIEELLKKGFDKWGSTGIQTNGTLITDAHIALFEKYKTNVGLSLDGPDELNNSRWAGTDEATRQMTARTHDTIKKLCALSKTKGKSHLLPSIILTLHSGNCSVERFPKFVAWLKDLDAMGIKYVNPHVMELDDRADTLYLPQEELSDRLIDLWNLQGSLTQLRFNKFDEVLKLLEGDDSTAQCHWHACDPLNTAAVQSVDNNGTPSMCARTFKDNTRWLPAEGAGYNAPLLGHQGARHHERQLALYVTPQEFGGCKDCEYWLMCMGQCPGEGKDGTRADWRMHSHYCLTWKKLFAEGARRLRLVGKVPLSDWTHRKQLEESMYELWATHQQPISLTQLASDYQKFTALGRVKVPGGWHGDHTDA